MYRHNYLVLTPFYNMGIVPYYMAGLDCTVLYCMGIQTRGVSFVAAACVRVPEGSHAGTIWYSKSFDLAGSCGRAR